MKTNPAIAGPCATRRVSSWVGGAVTSLGLVFAMTGVAQAAAPAAGTLIGNQASATYTDTSNLQQVATSNLVQTTVQQVGSFTLTADNTKTVAAGQTAYMPHTLTNTGNGTDTFTITDVDNVATNGFSRVEIFADVNADGVPDNTTPLCSTAGAPLCTTGFPVSLAGGGVYNYVVALMVPGSFAGAAAPYGTATTTVTAATTALYASGSDVKSNTDTVNVTIGTAFSLTKAVAVPGASTTAPAPLLAWPAPLTSALPSAASCTASLGTIGTAGCYFTTYTLTYKNTGAAVGDIYIEDAIPSGMTYVPGSAKWSTGNATLTDAAAGDPAGMDFFADGTTLKALATGVNPNVTATLSFIVMVNSTATVGAGNTTNVAKYTPDDSACASASVCPTPSQSTNGSPINVLQSYGVVANNTAGDATAGVDALTAEGTGANLVLNSGSSAVGGRAVFSNIIHNTGRGPDTFNITLSPLLIGGVTVNPTLFKSDGATPMTDSNADGILDTGPIAANTSFTVVVKYAIPASACSTVATCAALGDIDLLKTARSVGDPSKVDSVTDRIAMGSLQPPSVDLTNDAANTLGAGAGDATVIMAKTVVAGAAETFSLFINNTGATADTYNLSYTVAPLLPAGWTVSFTSGTCGSGGAVITSLAVAAGQQAAYCANIVTTAGTAAGNSDFTFKVTSVGTGASDTKVDRITIASIASLNVTPDQFGQLAPGGTVVYPFTLVNNGNTSCGGNFTVSANLDAAALAAGWTATIFHDVDGNAQIGPGDTALGGPTVTWINTLTAGTNAQLLVRVFAPGGVTAGAQSVVNLTVETLAGAANLCASDSATGTTTVVSGQLRVQKTQALDTACDGADTAFSTALITAKPGQCVVYQVVATNEGDQQVTAVSINDGIPAHTTYQAIAAASCVVDNNPGLTTTPIVGGASGVSCGPLASLLPGGTVTMTFAVKINQ